MRQVDYSRIPRFYPAAPAAPPNAQRSWPLPPEPANLAAIPSAPPPSAEIRVGENGRIHGVDGMLDQIAGALVKHARPVLLEDVLPVVRSDVQMQQRIGAAIGKSMADELRPWIVIGTVASIALTAVGVAQWWRTR